MLITSTVRICYELIIGDVIQSGGSWWEQWGMGVGEDLKALGKREEQDGGGSYSGGEGGKEEEKSSRERGVTVTVGERSMQEAGMLTGVSDGLDRLQQHSETYNSHLAFLF